jgi:hypothetical protein
MAKPSPTGLPLDKMRAAMAEMGGFKPMFRLMVRTAFMESLRDNGEISNVEMIFADLEQYVAAVQAGQITTQEINADIEERRDLPSVLVPVWYLETLMACFHRYASSDGGVTFGEAFKLEGGGQGARKRVSKLSEIIRDMNVCDQILAIRAAAEESGAPIYIEAACRQLSKNYEMQKTPLGEVAISRAFRKYGVRYTQIAVGLSVGDPSS